MTAVLITTSSFDQAKSGAKELLQNAGLTVHENPFGRPLTEAEVSALMANHQPAALIAGTEPLTAAVLQAAKSHLKLIARCGTGMDSVDVRAASELGIGVCNTPEAPAQAVAELTLGFMLGLVRQIIDSDQSVKAGAWKKTMGQLLGERVIGIVGLGRVGKKVALLAGAFGARSLATDINPDHAWAAENGVPVVSFKELLAQADLITVHASLGSGRQGALIDEAAIASMKRGSYLVNTARGGLIDEAAAASALKTGHLAGAAMDTFEQEPYTGPLTAAPHVILTPHVGSYAKSARVRMEHEAVEQVIRALSRLELIQGLQHGRV